MENNNLMDQFYDEDEPKNNIEDKPLVAREADGTIIVDDAEYYQRDSKGRFGRGNLGKRAFSVNAKLRDVLKEFVIEKAPELWDIWDQLSPERKADLMVKLIKISVPPLDPSINDSTHNALTITLVEAKTKEDGAGTHKGIHEESGSTE